MLPLGEAFLTPYVLPSVNEKPTPLAQSERREHLQQGQLQGAWDRRCAHGARSASCASWAAKVRPHRIRKPFFLLERTARFQRL